MNKLDSTIYQAPLPKNLPAHSNGQKGNELTKALARAIFLPSSNSTFFPKLLSYFTDGKNFNRRLEAQKREAINNEGALPVHFETGDGATIDGMYFHGSSKKAILYVGGQNERYELGYKKMRDLKEQAGNPALFVFNPRGVGDSKGDPNGKTLAIDVYSAFRYLVDVQKIDPSDIVIFGHSLGGGYGAEGAKLVQEEYPDREIKFVSHNSFRDLIDLLQKKLCSFLFLIANKLIRDHNWQLNAIDALRSLKGKKMIIVNRADRMIEYRASLYKGVKQADEPFEFIKFKMDSHDKNKDQHSRRFNALEMAEVSSHVADMLNLTCSTRAGILANLNRLEKALEKKDQHAIKTTLSKLEGIYKTWGEYFNIAHLLFKRIYLASGANSSDPEFGRRAFLGCYPSVNDETKLEIVRTLKMEIIENWK
ncbi:MAG: hypothetical protein WA347_04595 [Rhabdochlamydiaceae bacterium]